MTISEPIGGLRYVSTRRAAAPSRPNRMEYEGRPRFPSKTFLSARRPIPIRISRHSNFRRAPATATPIFAGRKVRTSTSLSVFTLRPTRSCQTTDGSLTRSDVPAPCWCSRVSTEPTILPCLPP
jgi:hypothetical protein